MFDFDFDFDDSGRSRRARLPTKRLRAELPELRRSPRRPSRRTPAAACKFFHFEVDVTQSTTLLLRNILFYSNGPYASFAVHQTKGSVL